MPTGMAKRYEREHKTATVYIACKEAVAMAKLPMRNELGHLQSPQRLVSDWELSILRGDQVFALFKYLIPHIPEKEKGSLIYIYLKIIFYYNYLVV